MIRLEGAKVTFSDSDHLAHFSKKIFIKQCFWSLQLYKNDWHSCFKAAILLLFITLIPKQKADYLMMWFNEKTQTCQEQGRFKPISFTLISFLRCIKGMLQNSHYDFFFNFTKPFNYSLCFLGVKVLWHSRLTFFNLKLIGLSGFTWNGSFCFFQCVSFQIPLLFFLSWIKTEPG